MEIDGDYYLINLFALPEEKRCLLFLGCEDGSRKKIYIPFKFILYFTIGDDRIINNIKDYETREEFYQAIENYNKNCLYILEEFKLAICSHYSSIKEERTDFLFRSNNIVYKLTCNDYNSYNFILNKLKFKFSNIKLCYSYQNLNDMILKQYGIYSKSYINIKVKDVKREYNLSSTSKVIITEGVEFAYKKKIGAFDLEMLTLDPLDIDMNVYMCSFCLNTGENYLIYTNKFMKNDIDESKDVKDETDLYIKQTYSSLKDYKEKNEISSILDEKIVEKFKDGNTVILFRTKTMYSMIEVLFSLIYESEIDVLIGYNIYMADIKLIYGITRKLLKNLPALNGCVPYYESAKKLEKKNFTSGSGIVFNIPGIEVVDMYRCVAKLIPPNEQKSLTLSNVSKTYLKEDKLDMNVKILLENYKADHSNYPMKLKSIKYCIVDSRLTLRLYDKFNVEAFTGYNYEISGINSQRFMSLSSLLGTYGIINAYCTKNNIMLDQSTEYPYRPGGGMIISNYEGHLKDVYILDVNSLYPSIVIQYNLCFRTIKRNKPIHDNYTKVYDKDDKSYYIDHNIKSVSPTILKNLLSTRNSIKKLMESLKAEIGMLNEPSEENKNLILIKQAELRILEGKSNACKLAANSYCGAPAEQSMSNPISHCLFNDIITTLGRSILSHCNKVLTKLKCDIIYGDTDSLMIMSKMDINKVLDEIHSTLDENIRFKLEYKADDMIMGKKKHYITNEQGKISIKGFKCDKPSSPIACRKLAMEYFQDYFKYGARRANKNFTDAVELIKQNPIASELCVPFKYSGKVYSPGTSNHYIIKGLQERNIQLVAGHSYMTVHVKCSEEILSYIKEHNTIKTQKKSSKSRKNRNIHYNDEDDARQASTTINYNGIDFKPKNTNKSKHLLTLEEVVKFPQAIDIDETFSNMDQELNTILRHIETGKVKNKK